MFNSYPEWVYLGSVWEVNVLLVEQVSEWTSLNGSRKRITYAKKASFQKTKQKKKLPKKNHGGHHGPLGESVFQNSGKSFN